MRPTILATATGYRRRGCHPRVLSDWQVVRFLADQVLWPYPDGGALVYLRDHALAAMERGEEWHWTLRMKNDPEAVIGLASLFSKRI